MVEQNPWKTPFGRLLIGSSIVAAVVGFALAAGAADYFRTTAAAEEPVREELLPSRFVDEQAPPQNDPVDVMTDPAGYAAALAQLPTAAPADGAGRIEENSPGTETDSTETTPAIEGSAPSESAVMDQTAAETE